MNLFVIALRLCSGTPIIDLGSNTLHQIIGILGLTCKARITKFPLLLLHLAEGRAWSIPLILGRVMIL